MLKCCAPHRNTETNIIQLLLKVHTRTPTDRQTNAKNIPRIMPHTFDVQICRLNFQRCVCRAFFSTVEINIAILALSLVFMRKINYVSIKAKEKRKKTISNRNLDTQSLALIVLHLTVTLQTARPPPPPLAAQPQTPSSSYLSFWWWTQTFYGLIKTGST